jgi:hypothetical protein
MAKCPNVRVNDPLVDGVLALMGITIADLRPGGPYWATMQGAIAEVGTMFESEGEAAACEIGWKYYGPGGKGLHLLEPNRAA